MGLHGAQGWLNRIRHEKNQGEYGGWSRLHADFFVGDCEFFLLKRLQIANICVYLWKNSDYETDQGDTRASYGKA